MEPTVGERFVRAVAEKDFAAATALMSSPIDFRALSPSTFWEASSPEEVAGTVLPRWYEAHDNIDAILSVETDVVGGRHRIGYRYAVSNDEGPFVVEQQAYYEVTDGLISWMRIMCSGWQPREGSRP